MTVIRRIFQRLGIYHRLRYSPIYESYLHWRNPGYYLNLQNDSKFYSKILTNQPVELIFDVGANNGDKCWAFAQFARRVICIEPDPLAQEVLTARFRRQPNITIISAAAGPTEGQATFHQVHPGSAHNSLSDKHVGLNESQASHWTPLTVPVTTLDALIAEYGRPDFVKIDVEGFEIEVIHGLSQPIPIICFESNLPGFAQETLAVIDRLTMLDSGYRFNARQVAEYGFVFPENITADDMKQFIVASEPQAYDVFAFQQ